MLHGLWDLSSLNRDPTHVPCIAKLIRNHRTTRKVPGVISIMCVCTDSVLAYVSPQAWCPPMTSTSGICQDLPSRSLESPTHLRPPTVTLLLKHFMVGTSSWLCINLYWVIDLCVSMLFYTSWRQAVLVRICLLLLKEAYESLLNRGQRLDGCYLEFPLRKLRLNLFRQILVFCSFRSEFWIHLSRGWRGKSKLSTFILRKPQEVTWAKFGVA